MILIKLLCNRIHHRKEVICGVVTIGYVLALKNSLTKCEWIKSRKKGKLWRKKGKLWRKSGWENKSVWRIKVYEVFMFMKYQSMSHVSSWREWVKPDSWSEDWENLEKIWFVSRHFLRSLTRLNWSARVSEARWSSIQIEKSERKREKVKKVREREMCNCKIPGIETSQSMFVGGKKLVVFKQRDSPFFWKESESDVWYLAGDQLSQFISKHGWFLAVEKDWSKDDSSGRWEGSDIRWKGSFREENESNNSGWSWCRSWDMIHVIVWCSDMMWHVD